MLCFIFCHDGKNIYCSIPATLYTLMSKVVHDYMDRWLSWHLVQLISFSPFTKLICKSLRIVLDLISMKMSCALNSESADISKKCWTIFVCLMSKWGRTRFKRGGYTVRMAYINIWKAFSKLSKHCASSFVALFRISKVNDNFL